MITTSSPSRTEIVVLEGMILVRSPAYMMSENWDSPGYIVGLSYQVHSLSLTVHLNFGLFWPGGIHIVLYDMHVV